MPFYNEVNYGLIQAFKDGGVSQSKKYLQRSSEKWSQVSLTIGLVGAAGSGKTSLVNALRDVRAGSTSAGPTGLRQTTISPTSYQHIGRQPLTYWDLPGYGTASFHIDAFIKRYPINTCDVLVLVSASVFTEDDALLCRYAAAHGIPLYYVRTNVDTEYDSYRKYDNGTLEESEFLDVLRGGIGAHLTPIDSTAKIYLVSCRFPDRFEMKALKEALTCSHNITKRDAIERSMRATGSALLADTSKIVGAVSISVCALTALATLLPVLGMPVAMSMSLILLGTTCWARWRHGLSGSWTESLRPTQERLLILLYLVAGNMIILWLSSKKTTFSPFETINLFLFGKRLRLPSLVTTGISFGYAYTWLSNVLRKFERSAESELKASIDEYLATVHSS